MRLGLGLGHAAPQAGTATLVLRIADDGIGFDAPAALGLGIGFSSMRARMERMGGSLQVSSRPGETLIEAVLGTTPPQNT
ncbi:hypothetical protein [Comamonas sp. GB3 AK4-5]|uniref:hypothetical protein n=1 Tax=Comamonas sp. GB3 AK4-5 TaxID=3231487 RepID=UPI00351DC369